MTPRRTIPVLLEYQWSEGKFDRQTSSDQPDASDKFMTEATSIRRTETNIPPGTGCVQQQEMLYHWKTTLLRY